MTVKRNHPCGLDIPAYDLGALVSGIASVAQIIRALNDQSFSEWQFIGLCVTLLLTFLLAYKANRTTS